MGKYIDAEKLSFQIEKLFPDSSDERIVEGFEYALDKVKAIIDHLQQEQQEVDFEEEWEEFNDWMNGYNQTDYPTCYGQKQIARHFYELGLNTKK